MSRLSAPIVEAQALLPTRWRATMYGSSMPEFVIVDGPNGIGSVTIDTVNRGYRSGVSTTSSVVGTAKYTGRGWLERLVKDAVKHLQGAK